MSGFTLDGFYTEMLYGSVLANQSLGIFLDVDGTLTDGTYQNDQSAAVHGLRWNTQDFHALQHLTNGENTHIITGSKSSDITRRFLEFGHIPSHNVRLGITDKLKLIQYLLDHNTYTHVLYIGDDTNDLGAMLYLMEKFGNRCHIGLPANATPFLRLACHAAREQVSYKLIDSSVPGGSGAVANILATLCGIE